MNPNNGHGRLAIVPPSQNMVEKADRFLDRIEQVKALRNPEAAAPAAAPARQERFTFGGPRPLDPWEILSPSSVNQFANDCQVKWMYRRVLGLPETPSAALGLGKAVHLAVAENFRQKIETKEDLPTEGVTALFHGAMTEQLDHIVLDKTDSATDLHSCGEVMTRLYMDRIAPRIQPAAVELPVQGLIGTVPVQGFIDLLDVNGDVIDLKTAKRKPSGSQPGYRLQVATYTMLEPTASGRARLDTVTKTKTVDVHQQTIQIGEADRLQATRLYAIAQEQMKAGVYLPNRASHLCSRKYCSYWKLCQDEYGGEVS